MEHIERMGKSIMVGSVMLAKEKALYGQNEEDAHIAIEIIISWSNTWQWLV